MKNVIKKPEGNQRNSDRPKTSEQSKFFIRKHFGAETKKLKEDFDFFFHNNASQPKKRKYEMKKISS